MTRVFFIACFLLTVFISSAQEEKQIKASTYIDDHGIMRWTESQEEVCVFGTNYSVPFAYWNERAPIGADYEKAIDEDVYHIARMGLDGYRVHIWESYISDTLGNLKYNRHFQVFDYLMAKLKERGIKAYVTPMYLSGGNTGFTHKYGMKLGNLSNPEAFEAHENYLEQFVSHVNPYTGIAYKDDPDILAFEIVNEPGHWKRPDLTTAYINKMYDAIRSTGCEKPLFYNMTTSADQIDKILSSKVEGGSFQWYPSGLTSNHNQKGNMLPNADQYTIPFANDPKMKNRPKFVYEFSPSDIGASSHIYPAMARTFRGAGFQFAAHFAYDPMHAAYCNIEYKTHYLNLAYTPKKAVGLMIASEVFHRVPLGENYGKYPKNTKFETFSLNSDSDLAEMVTEQKFLYTTNTTTQPLKSEALEKVVGTGTSPIVAYNGTGVYILDKLENGVWRLEVMPDAVWVRDPFFVPDVKKEVAVILWKNHKMTIKLPDLGSDFVVKGLNDGNNLQIYADHNSFSISPGTYMLTQKGKTSHWGRTDKWKNIQLNEFHAPTRKLENTYVLHTPPRQTSVGKTVKLTAKIVAPFEPEQVEVIILGTGNGDVLPMTKIAAYDYQVEVPETFMDELKIVRYNISIKNKDNYITYPSGEKGSYLLDRRLYSDDRLLDIGDPYEIPVLPSLAQICIFDAKMDWKNLTKMKRNDKIDYYPTSISGQMMMHLSVSNLNNIEEHNFTVRSYCRERIEERQDDLGKKQALVVYGNSLNGKPCEIQMALLMKDGSAFGGILTLDKETASYKLRLKDLKKVKSVLLPRPYPKFHDYWFEPSTKERFEITEVESLQISIGPGISEKEFDQNQGVAIGRVSLE